MSSKHRDYLKELDLAHKTSRECMIEAGRTINYLRTVITDMLPFFPKDHPYHVGFSEAAEGIEPGFPTEWNSSSPDSSLGAQRDSIVLLRIFQEELAQVGVGISLGAIQARTDDELHQARLWAAAYAADGESCKIEKPSWLHITAQGAQP